MRWLSVLVPLAWSVALLLRRAPLARKQFVFDGQYRERFRLRSGTSIAIRLVRPEDKDLYRKGLLKVSPQTVYQRFFTPKKVFTEDELRYLTEFDGEDHMAIGAATTEDGERAGVGVARFIRLHVDPTCADAAIFIADRFQGQGIGEALVRRLAAAALERGIATFYVEVLATNAGARKLFEKVFPWLSVHHDGATVRMEVPLRRSGRVL